MDVFKINDDDDDDEPVMVRFQVLRNIMQCGIKFSLAYAKLSH